jgi:hypothetical protein
MAPYRRRKDATSPFILSLIVCISTAGFVINIIFTVYIQKLPNSNGQHLFIASTQLGQSSKGASSSEIVISTSLSLPTQKKFAYAFYATDEEHACGAFVNVAALRDTGTRNETDFVMLTYGFENSEVREQASRMNVIVKDVAHLNAPRGGNMYYQSEIP